MTLRLQWHRLKITPVVTSYPERNEKKAQLVITLFLFHSLCFNNSAFFFFPYESFCSSLECSDGKSQNINWSKHCKQVVRIIGKNSHKYGI